MQTYTQKAVERAIEGGYKEPRFYDEEYIERLAEKVMLLDPNFWKALGKSMGWQEYHPAASPDEWDSSEWFEKWHYMVDHLASGGTIEDYFKKLLSDNT